MLLFNLACFFFTAGLSAIMNLHFNTQPRDHWYIYDNEQRTPQQIAFQSFFSFYLIINLVIPLDLLCGTEIQKLLYTPVAAYDAEYMDPNSGKSLVTRAINLWDELGEVEYMFCDKTGTLTQNKLIFKRSY